MSSPPSEHDEHETSFDPTPHVPNRRAVATVAAIVGASLVAIVGLRGLGHREATAHASDASAPASPATNAAPLKVQVATAHAAPDHPLTLPGHVEALEEAAVYARVNGYLKRWLVDIGDSVEAAQTLAEIDTPELDQELAQAEAAIGQAEAQVALAKAKRELARTTLARTAALAPSGLVPQQDLDDKKAALETESANVTAMEAALRSARANLGRLEQLKRFARVVAPFAGTVTARTTERGQLVTAGSGAGQSLFRIAATRTMRVFVDVPQAFATSIARGQRATVTVREYPDRTFAGEVARTSRALDPTARTLRTEIDVPNADGALLRGMFAEARIAGARSAPLLAVPSTAIALDARGTRVAVVDEGRVRWRAVQVEEDLGREVTLSSGLRAGERVVANPTDALKDGDAVEPTEAPPHN